jgi:diguanylate cyclase (GGDEF)-like protein
MAESDPIKKQNDNLSIRRDRNFQTLMSALFCVYLLTYSALNLFLAHRFYAIALFAFFLLFTADLVIFRKPKLRKRRSFILVAACAVISVYSFWNGGSGESGYIWAFVFAPLTFYLLGKRLGLIYNLLLLFAETTLFFLARAGVTGHAFRPGTLLILLTALVFLVIFLYGYEYIQEQNRTAVEQKTKQLLALNEDLMHLAHVDFLTELLNRRKIIGALREEIDRYRRYQTPVSVILLDVDHFKSFNDTYGHPFGDEVLRLIARTLKSAARETDRVGRCGGEEFLIVLPSTTASDAMKLAERARLRLRDISLHPKDGVDVTVTASFAVAQAGEGENDSELFARVDRALYQSKNAGRDRVTMAE